jgi:hypothetical protein
LATIGAPARAATQALIAAARDPANRDEDRTKDLTGTAAYALTSVAPDSAIEVLREAIASGDGALCEELASQIAFTDVPARRKKEWHQLALSALGVPKCRYNALKAARPLVDASDLVALEPALGDDWVAVRKEALSAAVDLQQALGATAVDVTHTVVTLLQAALSDREAEVRRQAAWGLPRFGEAARPAVSALASHVADPDPGVRHAVIGTVTALKHTARDAGPALLAARAAARDDVTRQLLDSAIVAVDAGKTEAQLAAERDMRVLVARDWIKRTSAGVVFLSLDDADPTPSVIEVLTSEGLSVRPGSEAHEGPTGAWRLSIGYVQWVSPDLVHVSTSAWCGMLCAERGHSTLALEDGRWVLLSHVVTIVS